MLGSIFGKIMGESGASVGIANSLLKLLGEKSVVLVVMITGLVLSLSLIHILADRIHVKPFKPIFCQCLLEL